MYVYATLPPHRIGSSFRHRFCSHMRAILSVGGRQSSEIGPVHILVVCS